jgi:hypothetical protein
MQTGALLSHARLRGPITIGRIVLANISLPRITEKDDDAGLVRLVDADARKHIGCFALDVVHSRSSHSAVDTLATDACIAPRVYRLYLPAVPIHAHGNRSDG